jgi:hypothetical protein
MKNIYQTRFAVNGDVIDEFATYDEALQAIAIYYKDDIANGISVDSVEDQYEIYNVETEQVELITP